jgi:hypothetical protein
MPSGSHDINVKLLVLTAALSTVLVFSLIVATQAWFRYEFQQENQRKYVDVPYSELVELQESQLAAMNAPMHYADPDEKDRIIIPIDMAVNEIIRANTKSE